MDSHLKPHILFDPPTIHATVSRLAAEVTRDYHDKRPILLGVLKGSFMFLADLIRLLDFPLQVEFVQLSSYGSSSRTSGHVRVGKDITCSIAGRHAIVIEDIVDTGLTTAFIVEHLKDENPSLLR